MNKGQMRKKKSAPKQGKGWMITAIIFIIISIGLSALVLLGVNEVIETPENGDRGDSVSQEEQDEVDDLIDADIAKQAFLSDPLNYQSTGDFIATYLKVMNNGAENRTDLAKEDLPSNNIGFVPRNICPSEPDGPCGFGYEIWASELEEGSLGQYYFYEQGGAVSVVYGPFEGNLLEVGRDVRLLEEYSGSLTQ